VEDFPPLLASHIRQLLDTEPTAGDEFEGVKFNLDDLQKSYIEAKSCPVVGIDGAKLGHVIVGQDLTEHKKLEQDLLERTEETAEINEMLKRSRIEMAQREKMVAIGQMATGIAHEIGNPLASLSSVAQYLARKLTRHEEKEQLLMIENQVDRISTILRRMLSLSRPATSEYKWVDVNALIDNTLALIRFDRRAKSVEIVSVPDSQLPTVWLNPLHFEQVLLNITINALDAMSAKKTSQQNVLEITRRFEDEMIEIRICDTGIGMEPQVCRRAFESFFTTKEIGKGTGLGLFISYNLINELDGTINLDSQPGEGTTVTIRVPVRPKKHLISGPGPDKAAAAATRQRSEDDKKD
jgi:signal transduction histidine kinase